MFGLDERFQAPDKFATALDQVHDLASHEAGSRDFGAGDYLFGLRMLLESMDYDPHFTERGRKAAWGTVINTLAARARAVHQLSKMPGLDRVPISRPVVITGLHRTGTTALHKLLAVDPQFQGLQGWLTSTPMPRPPRATWDTNPIFRGYVEQLEARFASAPGLRAAHDMAAEEVEECGNILMQSFVHVVFTVAWSAGTYDAWWQSQSQRPAYHYFRRVIQMIGSNEPSKRWLLKHPPHIANLDLLFEIFPDALVIQTHRDPAKSIPSLCAMVMKGHRFMEVDREAQRARIMGYREVSRYSRALRDAEPVRLAHQAQVMDVLHGDFHRDPIGTLRKIYPFIGLELSPETEAAMRQRIAAAPEASHGTHRYTATDFGLTEDEIREQFGSYMDRFDLKGHGQ